MFKWYGFFLLSSCALIAMDHQKLLKPMQPILFNNKEIGHYSLDVLHTDSSGAFLTYLLHDKDYLGHVRVRIDNKGIQETKLNKLTHNSIDEKMENLPRGLTIADLEEFEAFMQERPLNGNNKKVKRSVGCTIS